MTSSRVVSSLPPESTVKSTRCRLLAFLPACCTRYSRKKKRIRCSEGGWLIGTGGGKRSSLGWRSGAFLLSSPLSRRPKTRLPSSRQGRDPYPGARTLSVLVVSLTTPRTLFLSHAVPRPTGSCEISFHLTNFFMVAVARKIFCRMLRYMLRASRYASASRPFPLCLHHRLAPVSLYHRV